MLIVAYLYTMTNITKDFFCPITLSGFEVRKNHIKNFKGHALDKLKPNTFYLETEDGLFKIIQDEKVFMVLNRSYTFLDEQSVKDEVNSNVMTILKIAKSAGFTVFLEPKYSN